METEKFYFRVGLFVITVMAVFVWYIMVFGPGQDTRNTIRYAAYFDGSVAGLTKGAPVRLKGLDIGLVSSIRFVSRENDRIFVLLDLSDSAPVRVDTVATIAFQGITGTTYLALENLQPGETVPRLEARSGQPYPVIRTRPSELQAILQSAPAVLEKLSQVSDQLRKIMSDRNVAAMQDILLSTQGTLSEAGAALREIRMLSRTVREDPSIILRGPEYQGYKPKK